MIFDLNKRPPEPVSRIYDVCIAGGGVAGITLAVNLAARGHQVALLEAGDFEYSEESQEIYKGPILGRSYFDLDSARLRYLGGSSNHWAGWCRPLDAHDFERHPYIPYSGWPFAKTEIDPYLEAASQILEIEPDYADHDVQDSDNAINQIEFLLSPPVNFRDKFEEELRTNERIEVFLNSNLVNIRLDESTGSVTGFECANYVDSSYRHTFVGRIFVLALGGIENPRLLLNCRDQMPNGIGNDRDLVGRFFMEHFHAYGGFYVANKETWPFGSEEVHLSPTKALMDGQRIANAGLRVVPVPSVSFARKAKTYTKRMLCANDIVRDFAQSIRDFRCPSAPPPVGAAGTLKVASEQVPNRESRVLLAEETDRFGLRRGAVDWRATDVDRRTIQVMVMTFARYLATHGYGSVKPEEWLLDDDLPIPGVDEDDWLGAGWHHMGTTRMAITPEEGVVDPNCGVFGVDNLYIAGSSVFPTGGHANPTLTIVQLTLRLGDHLDRTLAA